MLKKFAVILTLNNIWVVKRLKFGSYCMINCGETCNDIFWFLNGYKLTGVSYWSPPPQIKCTVYCKYANLSWCMPKSSKPYTFMYAFSSIAYCSFSTDCPWFCSFFTTHCNNCFVLWNVFHNRDRKIPYATLPQITHERYFT